MRYAIYFTPPAGERLTRLASNWLGRNAFTGSVRETAPVGGLDSAEIARHTAAPRRYGFHATLKAPFRLAEHRSEADLLRALMYFASSTDPVAIPRLRIERLGPFFALTPADPLPALDSLAAAVVREFDPLRRPLTDAEIERRNPEALDPRRLANLHRWGYPYVFEDFRFHMTLTGPVEESEATRVRAALSEVFEPALAEPVEIGALALFVEPEAGAPFTVHSLHPLGRIERRKTA